MEAGVTAEGQLGDGVGKRAARLALVLVLDGDPQVRGGQLVGRRVRAVEAEQPDVHLLGLARFAEQPDSRLVAYEALSSMSRPVRTIVMVLR